MEKIDDGVPSIWRAKSDVTNRTREWVKATDGKNAADGSRLRSVLASDVDLYSLAWYFPGNTERLLFFFGIGSQASFASISAMLISRFVRSRFYLGGRLADATSGFGAMSMAGLLTFFAVDKITLNKLFYDERSDLCFTCLQLKQAAVNIGTSVVVPAAMMLPESLYHSLRDPTYGGNVPRITEGKRLWQFVSEKYGGATMRRLGWHTLACLAVTGVGTYMQMKAATRISLSIDDDPSLVIDARKHGKKGTLFRLNQWWNNFWNRRA